MKLFWNQCR